MKEGEVDISKKGERFGASERVETKAMEHRKDFVSTTTLAKLLWGKIGQKKWTSEKENLEASFVAHEIGRTWSSSEKLPREERGDRDSQKDRQKEEPIARRRLGRCYRRRRGFALTS